MFTVHCSTFSVTHRPTAMTRDWICWWLELVSPLELQKGCEKIALLCDITTSGPPVLPLSQCVTLWRTPRRVWRNFWMVPYGKLSSSGYCGWLWKEPAVWLRRVMWLQQMLRMTSIGLITCTDILALYSSSAGCKKYVTGAVLHGQETVSIFIFLLAGTYFTTRDVGAR